MSKKFYSDQLQDRESCVVVQPVLKDGKAGLRDIKDTIEEIESLTQAISLEILETIKVPLSRIQAGYFLGKGKRAEISGIVSDLRPDVVIVNHSLSPVQQRNLETDWNTKVIDRTGLILEIFGERARTREGRLQVDLAALEYQKSRLVRSWTHLERQRGGAGFMGGPGERQIEIDRRLIGDKIVKLKKELEDVRRTRALGRKSRERVPYPIVSLVGYTNAGKSTLFNRLTQAKVFAKDLLFATLDPTMRKLKLPGGQDVILSDTVGFISDLPTHLIEAFRATLEQIHYADVIIHVIDCSRPDYEAQRADVIQILEDMGIEYEADPRIIEALNKADLLDPEDYTDFVRQARFNERQNLISAETGQGIDDLLNTVNAILSQGFVRYSITLPASEGKALSWLYRHAEVLVRVDKGEEISLSMQIDPDILARFEKDYRSILKSSK